MKWQKILQRIVKYAIVFGMILLSFSLALAQEFTLGQEKLLDGIFSPDGSILAMRTVAGVLLFDTDSLQPIQSLPAQGFGAYERVFSPDSRYLAWEEGARGAPTVRVWELATFTQVAYFRLSAYDISALLFTPGGELLAAQVDHFAGGISLPFRGTLHFWKVGTWEEHGVWGTQGEPFNGPGSVDRFAFIHDEKRFVASTTSGELDEGFVHEQFVVDVQTLKPVAVRETQEHILAYSPDGRFEVVSDGDMQVRDLQQHKLIANLSDTVTGYVQFHSSFHYIFSPDSKWLVTITGLGDDAEVILWNTQAWEIEHRMKLPIAHGFVKDSYWYAALAPTGELQIWDLIRGELLASPREGATNVQPVGFKLFTWGLLKR